MAFVVETGAGLTTANSYLSEADADTYHTDYGNPSAWSGATTSAKEDALRQATQWLDVKFGVRWIGRRTNKTQSLDWPRMEIIDYDGYAVATDELPQALKDATAVIALKVVNGDTIYPDLDSGSGPLEAERVKVGPIEVESEFSGSGSYIKSYRMAEHLLRGLIMSGTQVRRSS